jgi:hypothetical protein
VNAKSQDSALSAPPGADEHSATSQQKPDGTFQHFTLEQWISWLNTFFSHDPCSPVILIIRDEPLHHPLIRLYRSLNTKSRRDRFAEAITKIYQATSLIPENAEQLYYLLQLITYIKPLQAKELLRRDLREGALLDVKFGPYWLQRTLLVARTRYDVNDDIADYIYSSCNENPVFSYLLLCLDILASRNGDEAYRFVERIVPFLKSEVEAMHLGMQLRADLPITGYRAFYEWYMSAEEGMQSRFTKEWEEFKKTLEQFVLPKLQDTPSLHFPAYAVLLSAQLQARKRLLMADELYIIASQYKEVGEEVVLSALSDIWRRTAQRHYQRRPWCYDSPIEIPQMFWNNPERSISVEAVGTVGFTQRVFDVRVDPGIDRLFTAIEERFVTINENSALFVVQKYDMGTANAYMPEVAREQ